MCGVKNATAARGSPGDSSPATGAGERPADRETATLLPRPLSSFINRDQERSALRALLLGRGPDGSAERPERLITLTGPAGAGKTRLAIEVARALHEERAVEVAFVPLAMLSTSDLVLASVSRSLGLESSDVRSLADRLAERLQKQRVLLVLDNLEHVLGAVPALLGLLEGCQGLQMLITSRRSLGVAGEREYRVQPLALPNPGEDASPEALLRSDAVRLFIERAQAVRPDFRLTDENAAAVTGICTRLEGLPLGIELAAVRIRLLSPQALLGRLEHRLKLLTSGPRYLPERQQTLRGALSWSYELLSQSERALFRRLAVFSGGWTLEGAEAVATDRTHAASSPVVDSLTSLLEQNLLIQAGRVQHEPRFDMLDTVCEYAVERLAESGEEATIRRRHAEYFLGLVTAADQEYAVSRANAWIARLELERENLRTSFRRLQDRGEVEAARRFARAISGIAARLGDPAFAAAFDFTRAASQRLRTEGAAPLDGADHAAAASISESQGEDSGFGPRPAEVLSARELEVLRMLAAGRSNREIAAALGLSVHTVERHASNVYAKLGVRGKAAAASYVMRRGLSESS
jgi:predicted ATPase/DNA-binding CsgD family transcriptional regulator